MTFDEWWKEQSRDEVHPMLTKIAKERYRKCWEAAIDAANTLPHRMMFDAGFEQGQQAAAKRCIEIIMDEGLNWIETKEFISKEFSL